MMNKTIYNPDVLLTLANLSNDEVFTSPDLANKMLDLLPESIWQDKNATFLDPVSKTGVFLREITKRLIKGLEQQIPDLQERINHILVNQVFGIPITELTSLMTKRTLYCSKRADGKYSITTAFDRSYGNIYFPKVEHTWKNKKCIHCGASQEQYKRGKGLETHAYAFIHKKIPREFKDMKFDVIIGNPPYQLNDGGGTGSSAMPIYHKFIEQAMKLNPRYLTMIVPSRWFSGGRGLDEFRDKMLNDNRIRFIHDFPNSSDCFPGVQVEGGVNYFLWDRDNRGDATISTYDSKGIVSQSTRPLLEKNIDTFVRYNEAISILRKIQEFGESSFSEVVSSNDPFGFDVREAGGYKRVKPTFELKDFDGSVKLYYYGWETNGIGYIQKNKIQKNIELVDKYKVFISKAYGMGKNAPYKVINTPFIADKNTCSTETYLLIGPYDSISECENVISYINTKTFRFLVMLIKNTQNAMKKVYSFVPMQDFSKSWTDEELYKKYGLDENEINFIESMIKPMGEIEDIELDGDEDE